MSVNSRIETKNTSDLKGESPPNGRPINAPSSGMLLVDRV